MTEPNQFPKHGWEHVSRKRKPRIKYGKSRYSNKSAILDASKLSGVGVVNTRKVFMAVMHVMRVALVKYGRINFFEFGSMQVRRKHRKRWVKGQKTKQRVMVPSPTFTPSQNLKQYVEENYDPEKVEIKPESTNPAASDCSEPGDVHPGQHPDSGVLPAASGPDLPRTEP